MNDPLKELCDKLTPSERMLIVAQYWETTRDIIADNAPRGLSENELKRYVYEKMYHEPAPPDLWA